MEAVFAQYNLQRTISSTNRHTKNNTRKNTYASIYRTSTENLAPPFNGGNSLMYGAAGGMFYGPPHGLSYSYPPPSSLNPPLLPLPASKPYRTQSFSHPQVAKTNKPTSFPKNKSLTARKSKQPYKKEEPKKKSPSSTSTNTVPLGPDPNDLPKYVGFPGNLDRFSGSVFTLSPPPSSLPLPKFSMRPKLSCNAEAAAGNIDDGATVNLRRILRLH